MVVRAPAKLQYGCSARTLVVVGCGVARDNGLASDMRRNSLASLDPSIDLQRFSLLQIRQKKFSSLWPMSPSWTEAFAL